MKGSEPKVDSNANAEAGNFFKHHIPKEFEFVGSIGPVFLYRHKRSKWPFGCINGTHEGQLVGAILLYRDPTNSINLEMETIYDNSPFFDHSFTFVESQIRDLDQSISDDVWARFIGNIQNYLPSKRHVVYGNDETEAEAEDNPKHSETTVERTEEDTDSEEEGKDPIECMICMERQPNTTVSPCFHTVVCFECSEGLKNTPDTKICCKCRCPIDNVYNPDNTVTNKE